MARLNIEDKWLADCRREWLEDMLPNRKEADHVAFRIWRLSQEHWVQGRLIPGGEFIRAYQYEAFLKAGLARIYKVPEINQDKYPSRTDIERESNELERVPTEHERIRETVERNFIYVNGSREWHFWLLTSVNQRRLAGIKSAEARLIKFGTSQPKTAKRRTKPERTPNEVERAPERDSNGPEPSTSVSSSNSSSNSVFENIYAVFPKRDGDTGKKKGIQTCVRKFPSEESQVFLRKAVTNYATYCQVNGLVKTRMVKQFATFVNGDVTEWAEYTPPPPTTLNGAMKSPQGETVSEHNRRIAAEYLAGKTDEPAH